MSGRRRPRAATALIVSVVSGLATQAFANDAALTAFAANCLSPRLTADVAMDRFGSAGARHDFYDLAPFPNVPPSPAATPVTPGTDRRCELSFDGDAGAKAAETATLALAAERIATQAPLPPTHMPLPGTTLLAARALNPARIAVVHTGTRPGPDGIETFLSVERLTPDASREVLQ